MMFRLEADFSVHIFITIFRYENVNVSVKEWMATEKSPLTEKYNFPNFSEILLPGINSNALNSCSP